MGAHGDRKRPRASDASGGLYARKTVSLPPDTMARINAHLAENPEVTLSKFLTDAAERALTATTPKRKHAAAV